MRYRFNNTKLSEATLNATCAQFAANALACIQEVLDGSVTVNNQAAYIAQQQAEWERWMKREIEPSSVTFLQLAYAIQTGKELPLLP